MNATTIIRPVPIVPQHLGKPLFWRAHLLTFLSSVVTTAVCGACLSIASGQEHTITLPESQLTAAGIRVEKVVAKPFSQSIQLTGSISLNEDRLAHIYPIVDGQVESVHVGLGDTVKEGELLLVVHSRDVGTAMLDLYQARLQLELARVKQELQQEMTANTQKLLRDLRERLDIISVQERYAGQNLGDYRERLLMAYSNYVKSNADVERLKGIADTGAIASKQLLAAQAGLNADLATFQARIEQIEYEVRTANLQISQQVKEAETRVAVSTANLQILGCESEAIQSVDPLRQGEAVSDYTIRAPFEGTVIWKDVVLREQVRPDKQLFSIADLSSVWIEAHVYEKDVQLLQSLKNHSIRFRTNAWPDREFEAEIFYTGEIMDEATRTISMRALAQNPDHLLKPGMFVDISIAAGDPEVPVLQIPTTSLMEYEGQSFVFVQTGKGTFERRSVTTGLSNRDQTIVTKGLQPADEVVIAGGFVLKSKMLESLLGEE